MTKPGDEHPDVTTLDFEKLVRTICQSQPHECPNLRDIGLPLSQHLPFSIYQQIGIMADKEASVYIVDVGSTVGDCNNGRTESDLDWSMRFVWDKIATTAQAQRKTLCVGVVGLRTDETVNDYVEGDGYANISILQNLDPVTLSDMKRLKTQLLPSNTDCGDAMSAIIIATEMIVKFTKKNKWTRKIYLVTDGQGDIDEDDTDDIAMRLNDVGVTLTVV